MSASNKKKLRKEQEAAMMTEKQLAEKKEARKIKQITIASVAVLILIVAAFIGIIVKNSGLLQRCTTAVKVGNHKVSSVELNYGYVDAITSFMNEYGGYASMFGLDTTKPLNRQNCSLSQEEGDTWADYFTDQAAASIRSTYAMCDAAAAAGHTLSEEEKSSVDSILASVDSFAASNGFSSTDDYLKALYGPGSTAKIYRAYYEAQVLASSYYNAHMDSLEYTDDDLRAAEAENFSTYSSFTYNTYYLNRSSFLDGGTTDEEGNTTYSDEEYAAAVKAAEEAANSLTTLKITSLEEFDAAIAALSINKDKEDVKSSATTDTLYGSVSTVYRDWVSDSSRKAGDTTVIANTSKDADGNEVINGYYAIYFVESNDNTYPLANVRHILVGFEGGTKDANGNTTYSETEKNAAKTTAQAILDDWKAGDATEESFAALATEKTTDPGSKENGGLYEDVYPGQMVANFNDWCFDESRKPGDTGLVETNYGYHIMYYVGDSETNYRDFMIENNLTSTDMDAWATEVVENAAFTVKSTAFVQKNRIIAATSAQ